MVLGSDEDAARITLRPSGVVEIAQGSAVVAKIDADGTVHLGGAAGSLVALAELVDARLASVRTWLNAHTHPTPSGASSAPTVPLGAQASVAASKVSAV